MKPRISPYGGHLFNPPPTLAGKAAGRRYVISSSSPSSSASSPPKQRLWLRLAVVTATAAGIGAYIRSQRGPESATLNPVTFTKYRLVAREPVSSNGSIFTLKPAHPEDNCEVYEEAWKTGVWSVMFKQPQLQIGRDYTPLPPSSPDSEEDGSLRFFIRKDPFGEVSRYLHALDLGSSIEVRGPRIECEIPADTRQILFIAGGTGIAPALQAGYTLLHRKDLAQKPHIHILWANRRRDDCLGGVSDTLPTDETQRRSWFSGLFGSSKPSPPPVDLPRIPAATSLMVRELEALKAQYPGQITVNYFIDEENSFIGGKIISSFTDSAPSKGSPGGKIILVSGPEGFISYMAGPKLWAQGMELQGPLQGVIKALELKDWAVWKL
ncbi:cytochrome b5 reductase family protein [Aspergillus clavatus NRRL 1]|uniref:Cytochrome c mitochondrial import factor (Cyc2), putative n=1 Tax=Aspergillus clavatus (strain ATCC 1007 / CBS 513.65 / DSM 816 / NCTC 3887 / NRRL 1 / QM 1276 / 107) TaxID=344612 RepID=A1CM36_ASPCL|nr:cytochrome c mitochondrial import factor (Cyc2), putative [Aspergillus clavatus NRRL 1]EAW08623.1 cytochrome c mitochondrial import factor (Cyc2), putative [Aspergillus clavatus NRRL 1]